VPSALQNLEIPLSESIAGHVLTDEDLLVVNDSADRWELAALSRGTYGGVSFAVIRLPLRAAGEPIGVLNVTERDGKDAFSARDRKLLEALSAMGASALLNCQLHASANRQMMGTIRALASAVDAKDHYTHSHSARVAQLALAAAEELKIQEVISLREVELAGMLHDVGKIGVPDAILSKADRLTAEEHAIVRSHAEIGARIVRQVDGFERVARAVLHHHERYDGLGYPFGLAGEEIPIAARIITVADVWDTLVSDRPYRKAVCFEAAMAEVHQCKGTHFDPRVADALATVLLEERERTAGRKPTTGRTA
jgi:putative nucleotidyltransferase with HDIG domain